MVFILYWPGGTGIAAGLLHIGNTRHHPSSMYRGICFRRLKLDNSFRLSPASRHQNLAIKLDAWEITGFKMMRCVVSVLHP